MVINYSNKVDSALRILICLFAATMQAISGETGLSFPPFPAHSLSIGSARYTPDLPRSELRAIMGSADDPDRFKAATALLHAGDQLTIARLVYALKQGNAFAEVLLWENASLAMVPYLLEDIARGSLEPYGYLHSNARFRRVRLAATEIAAKALSQSPEFPSETQDWLKYVADGLGVEITSLPEKSKFLIEWWMLNEVTILEGSLKKANRLPIQKQYAPIVVDQGSPDPPPLPPPPPPDQVVIIAVPEPFESWEKRILDSTQRDLRFAALSFENGKLVIGQLQRLNPMASSQLHVPKISRNTNFPLRSTTGQIDSQSTLSSWCIWCLLVVIAFGVVRLIFRIRA